MSGEAKFGLVIGLAVVIVVAVVFFRRDAAHARSGETTSAAVKRAGALPAARAPHTSSALDGETPFRPGAGVLPRQRPGH